MASARTLIRVSGALSVVAVLSMSSLGAQVRAEPTTEATMDLGAYASLLSNPAGTINARTNPLSWTQLKDVPPAVAGGTSGISGLEQVTETAPFQRLRNDRATVHCPPGKKVLGGGFKSPEGVVVTQSAPLADGTGWNIRGFNSSGTTVAMVDAYAICAKAEP
jgi:hypothetical protein